MRIVVVDPDTMVGKLLGLVRVQAGYDNVVLARKLWPRALLTPFTDAVDLTDADRKVYAMYAQMQRHKGFERVSVSWEETDAEPDPAP